MKFEGPPQFDSNQPTEKVDKPEIKVEPEQKILERAVQVHEADRVNVEKPPEKIEIREEQEPTREEIENHKEKYHDSNLNTDAKKEQPHEPIVEKEKVPQHVVVNREDIKRVGK